MCLDTTITSNPLTLLPCQNRFCKVCKHQITKWQLSKTGLSEGSKIWRGKQGLRSFEVFFFAPFAAKNLGGYMPLVPLFRRPCKMTTDLSKHFSTPIFGHIFLGGIEIRHYIVFLFYIRLPKTISYLDSKWMDSNQVSFILMPP